MCTGFVRRGEDVIVGFNMDINVGAIEYDIYAEKDAFYVGVKPTRSLETNPELKSLNEKDSVIRIQGVSHHGNFGNCLNNMNCQKAPFAWGENVVSIDQLIDRYLTDEISLDEIIAIANERELVNLPENSIDIPDLAMHSLLADCNGRIVILEPGNGYAVIREKYAVLTNFPMLELAADFNDKKSGFYGKDRYDKAMRILRESEENFGVKEGLELLRTVKQEGFWGTRVSFVYSNRENAVYYCVEGDFDHVIRHKFEEE